MTAGCDSTSAFHGKGKVSLLKVLEEFPEFYDTFARVDLSFEMDSSTKRELETFVCRMYKEYHVDKVDDAPYNIFRLEKYESDKMPFTKDALKKHMRRINYQAAIWQMALISEIELPEITDHGWLVSNA